MIIAAAKLKSFRIQKQMKNCGFAQVTHFNTRSQFTVHSARRKSLENGQSSTFTYKNCIVICFVCNYVKKIFQIGLIFFQDSILPNWAYKRSIRWDESGQHCVRRQNRGLLWDKPVIDLSLSFCFNNLSFWSYSVAFGDFIFRKLVTSQLFQWEILSCSRLLFTVVGYEKLNFYTKLRHAILDWNLGDWKVAIYLQLVKNWNVSTKIWQHLFFIKTPSYFTMLCKKFQNLMFVQGFWIYRFVKNQLYKLLANL